MRNPNPFLILACGALLGACAAPSEVARHWGEAQRGASQAMVEATEDHVGRGIDGDGAAAAFDNYLQSLQPRPEEPAQVLLPVVEGR